MTEPVSDSSNFVASLAKGLRVIECFGADAPRLTLTETAARTGLTRATARRFLLTLCQLGYVSTDGKYFEPTLKIMTLGQSYLSSLSFWDAARPALDGVTQATGESCSMAQLDGEAVVYIARSASPNRIMSVALFVGARLPAHATSMGQVLLAAKDERDLTAYLDMAALPRFTPRTLDAPAALRERLKTVRAHGYALADQELEPGLRSLAMPIRDRTGRTVAAMNISAHSARISRARMLRDFLPSLQSATAQIQRLLD